MAGTTGKGIYNWELPGRLARRAGGEPSVVFITYGEELARLIERAGEPDVIALGDAGNVEALAAALKRADLEGVYSIVWDNPNPNIPDTDKTAEAEAREKREKQGLDELADALEAAGIDASGPESYNGYLFRDAGEQAVLDHLTDCLKYWEKQAWETVKEKCETWAETLRDRRAGGAKGRERFEKALADPAMNTPVPTGFGELDKALDGGLFPGLYIIGAISALGKTTYVLQIADYIASSEDKQHRPKDARDVLIFSLEMSESELKAKSISRLTQREAGKEEEPYRKTTRQILKNEYFFTDGPEAEAERRYVSRMKDIYFDEEKGIGNHIYIREGMGDIGIGEIRRAVRWHTKAMGMPPVVIVDYTQILAPYNERWTDKQNTDKAILELKRLSRDLKTPVIAISSFNRDAYAEDASMKSFKESGAIEYGCDVLMALQRTETDKDKMKKEDDADARGVTAKILKNRNGKLKDIPYTFTTKFNCFTEGITLIS